MMIRISFIAFFLIINTYCCYSQKDFNDYLRMYPISENADIGPKLSNLKQETILFEANPIVRFSVYNNVLKGFSNSQRHVQAWYISYRPQLRMYTDNSLPIKTPSYRIYLGTQHIYRLLNNDFLGFSIESGHYSNGASGCAFSETIDDGTPACDSVYRLITPDTDLSKILNRKNGNFSTDLTELIINYRKNHLDENDIPDRVISVKIGLNYYHDRFLGLFNFGGYSEQDIKIYGHYRYLAGFEFIQAYQKTKRFSVSENLEVIQGAHKSVNPIRFETTAALYPFTNNKELGFFIRHSVGHDNYNYRFVDSVNQFSSGITWSAFTPIAVRRPGEP